MSEDEKEIQADPVKERIRKHLRKSAEAVHKAQEGKKGEYRLNVLIDHAGGLSKEELESMGYTVREPLEINNG